jgi:N-acetyl-gamma-glutamylphosphate reductase
VEDGRGSGALVRQASGGSGESGEGDSTSDCAEYTLQGALDNLLKGAATQCMQNLNLALGYDELDGIPLDKI